MQSDVPSSVKAVDPWRKYHQITRTATYGFLAALPLLLAYEALINLVNYRQALQVRVGADVWIKHLLAYLGAAGSLVLSAVVLLIGAGIFLYERKKSIPLRARYFGWMVAESACYAVVLAFLVSGFVGMLFAFAPAELSRALMTGAPQVRQSFWTQLALSIGAGLYEELVFRVILVGSLFWLFRRILRRTDSAYIIAAVLGALLFSAVHYVGALGDVFTLPSFTFRFLFGLALNAVFLVRGFGIAAWTHSLYDVMLVTHLLG